MTKKEIKALNNLIHGEMQLCEYYMNKGYLTDTDIRNLEKARAAYLAYNRALMILEDKDLTEIWAK